MSKTQNVTVEDYPGCTEISRGVFLADDAVYIVDGEGEVVCWVHDEVKEDTTAFVAAINACVIAAADGPEAVRKFLGKK